MMLRKIQGKDMHNQPSFFTIYCIFSKSQRGREIPGIFLCSEITGLVLVKGSDGSGE